MLNPIAIRAELLPEWGIRTFPFSLLKSAMYVVQ